MWKFWARLLSLGVYLIFLQIPLFAEENGEPQAHSYPRLNVNITALVDSPDFIIIENKIPEGSKKITISGLIVDENENPIPGTTVLVRKGPKRIVEGGSNVGKSGRFRIELAKATNTKIQYYVEAHHMEHASVSIPIKNNINTEIGIQLNKAKGTENPLEDELTPEQPFYRRFFRNLITPYQKLRGVLQIN